MQKLVRCFLNTDFRCQHDGLHKIATKAGINTRKLKPGEHVMFVNAKLNKLRMLSHKNILTYMKLYTGRIDLSCVQAVAQNFNEDLQISYNKALTTKVKKELRIK